jgi:hypothetical protein
MKIKTLSRAFVISVLGMMLTQAAFAQAPEGTITSPTFSGTEGLYDLTGVLSNLTLNIAASDGTPVPLSQNVNVVQSITGAITTGTTETIVTVMAEDGTWSNSASYTLKGAVKTSGGHILFSDTFALKSGSFLGGDPTYTDIVFKESATSLTTIDPSAGTITSTRSVGQVAMKLGKKSRSGRILGLTFEPVNFTPIDWNLSMTLTSTATKVAGIATINLANSRSFPFNAKGTTKNGVSKLTLTGIGIGRGATFKVTMSGNNITGITGTLLGQKVNLSE